MFGSPRPSSIKNTNAGTNGEKHLQELRAFVATFNAAFPSFSERTFTLENGIESLSRHFSNVTRADQPNNLSVSDAEPLVAYILSGAPFDLEPVSSARVADLRARIQSVIDQHGAFYITKSVGVFVASE